MVLLVVQKNLGVGEVIAVDISCIVAMTTSIDVQIKYNGPVRRAVFGVRVLYFNGLFFSLSMSSLRWLCNNSIYRLLSTQRLNSLRATLLITTVNSYSGVLSSEYLIQPSLISPFLKKLLSIRSHSFELSLFSSFNRTFFFIFIVNTCFFTL